ncbi:MAG: ATP-binding protein [Bdellovibrionia bacterium]
MWLRGIFCWLVGLGFLLSDYNGDFDLRLQARPVQKVDSRILLLTTEPEDWGADPEFGARQELREQTDASFWRPKAWELLLHHVLPAEPLAVGVSFFFNSDSEGPGDLREVQDPRVVWAARVDPEGRAMLPVLARTYGLNTGVVDFHPDVDGIVRRLSSPLVHIPIFGLRLAERATMKEVTLPYGYSLHVNYRGPKGTFPVIRYKDLLEGKITAAHLKDKIVVIGSLSAANHQVLTPMGFMSRAEVLANTADNILNRRWLRKLSVEVYALYLLAVLLLTIWIIQSYPQSVSTIFLGASGVVLTALSLWWFDAFYIWIPISSPVIQIAVTFIVFLSFQLSLNEQKAWRLEQEQIYMMELEQLKGNFLSLISHDLKTPIAKIQGITDRLMTAATDSPMASDLKSLRLASQDLHKYIHSILQLSRVEARELKINKQATDINELIERAVEQINPLAYEKSIELTKDLETLFSLEIDPVLIGEVILNLVDNAVKYTPKGGKVKVSSREEGNDVFVEVADTGAGIPEADLQRIWDKFYRVQEQAMQSKGSGLGLYLVRYFIELHGGKVFVHSRPGEGTRIGFHLPIETEGF